MTTFADNQWFEIEHCCRCGIPFAMTTQFKRARLDKRGSSFYCPAGHEQHYTGKTNEQKLKEQLDAETARVGRLQGQVHAARHERDTIAKAHRKMRQRVMNGVCPCCNRSFDNLRNHMSTQHPTFGKEQTLRALREAFGLTQFQVAHEADTKPAYVSLYERGKPVPAEARDRLDNWLDSQSA